MPADVEVCAVQLPGRENRFAEAPLRSWPTLVDRLAEGVRAELERPFALLGHSMGALLAFELACALQMRLGLVPLHLFVAGRNAPQMPRALAHLAGLDDEKLVEELRQLNGTPRPVLEDPDLMQLLLPVLKADFALCAAYTHVEREPLRCPITALGGLQDAHADFAGLQAWRDHTSAAFAVRMVSGDHFFLATHRVLVARMVAEDLILQ
jgi:medium-chain acyl-[acyl-carrier-protein] hydrolase